MISYQKVPSQTISYKIINIFASLWRGDRPFCPQVRSPLSNFYSPHITKQLQVHIAELKFHRLLA
ncbi:MULTISPECIES: hypothetical protein [unclassified Microcoleus]|uniref:hypothetical protein n=1 Tax=unclassified Microcoleus TaxID=2642155 RepID=UPI002FD1DEB5